MINTRELEWGLRPFREINGAGRLWRTDALSGGSH